MPQSIKELNTLYDDAERSLASHFAEIRTNILLDIGYHHPKFERFGNTRGTLGRDLPGNKKIRITKNHIQNITKFIRNSIQNRAPNCQVFPKNDKELADQKSAELNESVRQWLDEKYKLTTFYAKLTHDFVVCGECWAKVFHDPEGGDFAGYEKGEDGEEDESRPIFKPALIFERIPPYNLLTDPDADDWSTCSWVCIRKSLPKRKLEERYAGDEEKTQIIKKSGDDNKTTWFDGFTGIYQDTDDYIQVREFYFKSCRDYPLGYFYMATDHGVLEEGELPDGLPIFRQVYDESPENARGYGPIKNLKSFQTEINATSAAVITERLVLGHSTVIYQAGSKLSTSSIGNGLKGLSYASAQQPTVIPGRSGEQYIEHLTQTIEEMYRIAGVPNQDEDKVVAGQNDAMAMLFRSLRDKMRFSLYGEKIERLILDIVDYSLKLCRRYLPDDEIIPIVGKTEAVNIAEFRNTSANNYNTKIKPRSDDFASTMGKSVQLAQVMQYAGGSLPPDAIAHIVRHFPFLNGEQLFKDQTVMSDQADAVILALDRGEVPFFFERSQHDYMSNRLQTRMNDPSFPLLPKKTQLNYDSRLQAHEKFFSMQQQEAAQATAGFIPSGGGLISADYYVTTAEGKQQRARLPYEAVDWLVKKLATQGTEVEKISNQPLAVQADLGRMNPAAQNQPAQGQQPPQQQQQQPPQGQGRNPQALGNQMPLTGS